MAVQSAGILLFRTSGTLPEVLLVHPGGPFFVRRDLGYWTVPKGEYAAGEAPLDAAIREFFEETGVLLPEDGLFYPLDPIKQKGGKQVIVWAVRGTLDADTIKSNDFRMEWPKGSGAVRSFPEIDKARWFGLAEARRYINERQVSLIDQLEKIIRAGSP